MDRAELLRRVIEADEAVRKAGAQYAQVIIKYSNAAPRHVIYSIEIEAPGQNRDTIKREKR